MEWQNGKEGKLLSAVLKVVDFMLNILILNLNKKTLSC